MENSAPEPIRSTAELAARLGLSRWTVSRALNGHSSIRPATAERVRAAAREFGFAPDVFGRGLRAGRTNWVGVALPDLVDYFLTSKLTRLQRALHEAGWESVVQITEATAASERAALERFLALRCSSVVLIASQLPPDDSRLAALAQAGIPFVRIDPAHPGAPTEVATDRAHATRLAVRRLHEFGHRRLAVAGVDEESAYGRQRMEGLRRGCADCGWDFDRDIFRLEAGKRRVGDDFDAGFRLGQDFARSFSGECRAVVAVNDRVALGLIRALTEAGRRVPGDVSVLGYDDADFSRYCEPALTTFDPRVNDLIDRAVALLREPPAEARRVAVRPRLIERASLGPRD